MPTAAIAVPMMAVAFMSCLHTFNANTSSGATLSTLEALPLQRSAHAPASCGAGSVLGRIHPHRESTFKAPEDPQFVEKLTDVVARYLSLRVAFSR